MTIVKEISSGRESFEVKVPTYISVFAKTFSSILYQAPHLLSLVLVTAGFLWYIERHDVRNVAATKQQSEECHQIQKDSTKVMTELTSAVRDQTETLGRMKDSIDDLQTFMRTH